MDCCADGAGSREVECPECRVAGRSVPPVTVASLLKACALEKLVAGDHRFCASPGCDVVYFSRDNLFRRADVRVPVFQKEPKGQRTVCYCFEIAEDEADTSAEARVRAHLRAGRCACEVRNPEGKCCLGNLRVVAASEREVSRHG